MGVEKEEEIGVVKREEKKARGWLPWKVVAEDDP